MNSFPTKVAAWVGLVLAIAVAVIVLFGHSAGQAPIAGTINGGATVINNPYDFVAGIYLGGHKSITTGNSISIPAGANQGQWKNLSGQAAEVWLGMADLVSGTASSTIDLSIGTTSCAAVVDNFSAVTAPMWSQFIDSFAIATGSVGMLADNISGHKTNYPATILVPSGSCLTAVFESVCKVDGNSCGNTATSSNRGFSSLGIPFYYKIQ